MATIVTSDEVALENHEWFVAAFRTRATSVQKPTYPDPADIPESCCDQCPHLIVFAEMGSPSSDLYNDKTTTAYPIVTPTDSYIFTLQNNTGGVWSDTAVLTDPALGTDLSLAGTFSAFRVDWNLVLNAYGKGYYRIKTDAVGLLQGTYYTMPYCLDQYSAIAANHTVRFDAVIEGEHADINGYQSPIINYRSGFPFQIRVPGRFGKTSGAYAFNEAQQSSGVLNYTSKDLTVSYVFDSHFMYYLVHHALMFNVFMCDNLRVTDYNLDKQDYSIINLPILAPQDYSPNYDEFKKRKLYRVSVQFKSARHDLGGNITGPNC